MKFGLLIWLTIGPLFHERTFDSLDQCKAWGQAYAAEHRNVSAFICAPSVDPDGIENFDDLTWEAP